MRAVCHAALACLPRLRRFVWHRSEPGLAFSGEADPPFAIVTGTEFLVQETPGSFENGDPSAKDPTPSAAAGLKA
jgi:hypothetical protein